jgi:hypothetical protein
VTKLFRTIRFKPEDARLIDQFLEQNALFDFSTLARTAILQFVRSPKIELTAVGYEEDRTNTTLRPRRDKQAPSKEAIHG